VVIKSRKVNYLIYYYFLKDIQDKFIFLGTKSELEAFNAQFDLNLNYLESIDFLHLATMMRSYAGGVYNQSFLWHLADAMKLPRVLELCNQFPNTFPTGANGHGFYNQTALEYYTNIILKNDPRA